MLLSILLASIGVYLIVYSYLDDPHKIIARALKGGEIALPYPNRINTIYFIRNIDTGCTSCVRYLAYKAFPAVNITFMVEKDFSDIDIKNFRETFNIAEQDKIERVTAPWRTVFQKCTRKDQNPSNLLVVINEKEEPIYYRRF